jgi:O-antigen ligase
MRRGLTVAAEAVMLAAVLAAPWFYGGAPDLARYALAAAVALAGALAFVAWAIRNAGAPPLLAPAAALPALAMVQAVLGISVSPVATLEAMLLLAAMLAVAVFWSERARDRPAARRAGVAVLLLCAAQAAFGAVQWSRAPDRIYGEASPFVTTPFGSYVNHNHFAGLLGMGVALAAALAYGYVRRAGGFSPRVVVMTGLALGLAAVHLASRSRGGLIALAAGLATLAALAAASRGGRTAGGRGPVLIAAGLAVLVVGFGLAAVPETTRAHLATVFRGPADGSGTYRVDVAAATWRLFAARPVTGWGFGAFADAFPPYKRGHGDVRTTHAESDLLEFLAEGGLVGLALAAWLAWAAARGLSDRLRQGRDPVRKALAAGAAAAVAALAVHSLLDFNLRLPANALVFATLLGLAAAPREARARSGRTAPALAAAALLAVAGLASWRALGAHALDRAQRQPRGDRRLAAADRVVRWHPYLAEGWRLRGVAWLERGWRRPERGGPLEWAREDLEQAIRLRPRWAEPWAELGWVHYARGERRDAEASFQRASALDPTHAGLALAQAEFLARLSPR